MPPRCCTGQSSRLPNPPAPTHGHLWSLEKWDMDAGSAQASLTWWWVTLQQSQQLHREPGCRDKVIGVVLEVGGGRGDNLQEEGMMMMRGGQGACPPKNTQSTPGTMSLVYRKGKPRPGGRIRSKLEIGGVVFSFLFELEFH